MSKQFVGQVNGEKFYNEQDFQVAVAKAMFKGGELNISSCYKYSGESEQCNCGDDCKCNNNTNEEKKYIKISDKELLPDENFNLPKCVQDFDMLSMSDYSRISNFINQQVEVNENEYDKLNKKLKELKEQYSNIKTEMHGVEDSMNKKYKEWEYYNKLKDCLTKSKATNTQCNCNVKKMDEVPFIDFLNWLGFK